MIARNLLREEIKKAKTNAVCLRLYAEEQRGKFWTFLSWSGIDALLDFYSKYLLNLERIWFKHEKGIISDIELMDQLYANKWNKIAMRLPSNAKVWEIYYDYQYTINKNVEDYLEDYPEELIAETTSN
jgi:hypothetical protein